MNQEQLEWIRAYYQIISDVWDYLKKFISAPHSYDEILNEAERIAATKFEVQFAHDMLKAAVFEIDREYRGEPKVDVFSMLKDAWKFMKTGLETNASVEEMLPEADELVAYYGTCPFICDIMNGIINELQRRSEGRPMMNGYELQKELGNVAPQGLKSLRPSLREEEMTA